MRLPSRPSRSCDVDPHRHHPRRREARRARCRGEIRHQGVRIVVEPRVTELHCIVPLANIASVMAHGILSHERASKLPHHSVAMQPIQDKRDQKQVPVGLVDLAGQAGRAPSREKTSIKEPNACA